MMSADPARASALALPASTEPDRLWRISIPGNVPLLFFEERAYRRRLAELRRAGHRNLTVRTADIAGWRDDE